MIKVEQATLLYLKDVKYAPDIQIEIRPDKKRIVLSQSRGEDKSEIWIDVTDVQEVTDVMNRAVLMARSATKNSANIVDDEDDEDELS